MGQPPRRSGQSSSLVSQMLGAPDRWSLRYSRRGAEGKISHSTQRSEQCRVALCDAAKKQPERKALPSAPVPRRVQDVNSATLTYANASVSILNQRLSFPTIPLQNLTRPGGASKAWKNVRASRLLHRKEEVHDGFRFWKRSRGMLRRSALLEDPGMFATLTKLLQNDDGATAIEYGLIAALIAVAAVTVLGTVGTNVSATFNTVAGKL